MVKNQIPPFAIQIFIIAIGSPIIIWWMIPKFLGSSRSSKILIGAVIVSISAATTVFLVDHSHLQIQNIKFVTILTSLIWGFVGYLIGAYFDIRLRVQLGAKYYQEHFLRLRMNGVTFGVVGGVISLPVGVIIGWLVVVLGSSALGLSLSVVVGAIFGGLLGRILDRETKSSDV